MIPARTAYCRGSGPSRSDNGSQCPPGKHSLELTRKELRS